MVKDSLLRREELLDSLTQLALGAAVGEVTIGKKVGRKAAVWGAVLGTFPDLDVFIPMGDPVSDFIYHRSFSHSFFVLGLLSPLWVWFLSRLHKTGREMRWRWWVTVIAVFYTHVLLDSFTVYGTQIFWPLTNFPVSIGSVFIVDPLYTLPLLFGVLFYLIKRDQIGYRANTVGLALSSIYLCWSLGVQTYVKSKARDSLTQQGHPYNVLLVTPAPLNTILWRIVSIDQNGYHVGYYSLFDTRPDVKFKFISSRYDALPQLREHKPVQQLERFTHGLLAVDEIEKQWVISDVRMGVEPSYVFQFIVATSESDGINPIDPLRFSMERDIDRLSSLFNRILDEDFEF